MLLSVRCETCFSWFANLLNSCHRQILIFLLGCPVTVLACPRSVLGCPVTVLGCLLSVDDDIGNGKRSVEMMEK